MWIFIKCVKIVRPFVKTLLSISLNSTSKFKTRVLPSILEYVNRKGSLPKILSFSLPAHLAFYRGVQIRENSLIGHRPGNEYRINDDLPVLKMFMVLWSEFDGTKKGAELLVSKALSITGLWGLDLNTIEGFAFIVAKYLFEIITDGIGSVMKEVTNPEER